MADTTIYICADSTLTYGPKGGTDKVVPQALPVGIAKDEDEARTVITLLGRKAYDVPEADAHFTKQRQGKPIAPGYGPTYRYYYSGPGFVINDLNTVPAVAQTVGEYLSIIRRKGG